MQTLLSILVSVFAVGGALCVLISAVAMLRAPDALTRINALSPATGLGLPLIVTAAYLYQLYAGSFDWVHLVQYVITVFALVVVSSIGSNALARAAYLSGAKPDASTDPQDLAR
ncbi:cation:proton antiporter [Zhihengliuella salsuginis]|uniref:Multisubunit sodium/proton antiporter, MrpG subunit n=1 Tax=Zhihengliuella salsuginis TaxID=578222 RepID=A0ABQ3GGN4_9MICC|nr:monovalent cation/H(+) antiporter subunit G [Zhihengliuella salsuginis]GHD04917.1 hypothetical protein GCM10008096_12960 [Zhihengliuella salsuginis]